MTDFAFGIMTAAIAYGVVIIINNGGHAIRFIGKTLTSSALPKARVISLFIAVGLVLLGELHGNGTYNLAGSWIDLADWKWESAGMLTFWIAESVYRNLLVNKLSIGKALASGILKHGGSFGENIFSYYRNITLNRKFQRWMQPNKVFVRLVIELALLLGPIAAILYFINGLF